MTGGTARRGGKRVGKMPNMAQTSAYGAVASYLKAVAAAGTDETGPVLGKMHGMRINDFMTSDGWIRPDGRVMRQMYLLKVKSPAASAGPWDLEDVVGTLSPEDSFGPPSPACQLNKA